MSVAASSDDVLAELAGAKVFWRVHTDATTGEVWFVDGERRFRYFDGTGLADFDWSECEEARDTTDLSTWLCCERLKAFAEGWVVEDRTLCVGHFAYREVTRCQDKLIGKLFRGYPAIPAHLFTMQCQSVDAAKALFGAMAATPFEHTVVVDPYVIDKTKNPVKLPPSAAAELKAIKHPLDKFHGVMVRKIDARNERARFLWRLDAKVSGDEADTTHPSDDEAIAQFDRRESTFLQQGFAHWKLELDPDKLPKKR